MLHFICVEVLWLKAEGTHRNLCSWVPCLCAPPHQLPQHWSLSPCNSQKLLCVKTFHPKWQRQAITSVRLLQAIKPTKGYFSEYIKVYLQKETNSALEKWAKYMNRQFTEEKDPVKIWKNKKTMKRLSSIDIRKRPNVHQQENGHICDVDKSFKHNFE